MSSAEFEQGEEGFCGLFETFDDVPESLLDNYCFGFKISKIPDVVRFCRTRPPNIPLAMTMKNDRHGFSQYGTTL